MKTPAKKTAPTPMTAQQQELLRNAGAGALSDYARQAHAAGEDFTLSVEEAAFHGAGFIQDMFKSRPDDETPPPQPIDTPPALNGLDPNTAVLGSADITLICNGENFTDQTVIMFAGQVEPTTFVSDKAVTTGVKPSLGWGAVTVDVWVDTGGLSSEMLPFTFTEPAARKGK